MKYFIIKTIHFKEPFSAYHCLRLNSRGIKKKDYRYMLQLNLYLRFRLHTRHTHTRYQLYIFDINTISIEPDDVNKVRKTFS